MIYWSYEVKKREGILLSVVIFAEVAELHTTTLPLHPSPRSAVVGAQPRCVHALPEANWCTRPSAAAPCSSQCQQIQELNTWGGKEAVEGNGIISSHQRDSPLRSTDLTPRSKVKTLFADGGRRRRRRRRKRRRKEEEEEEEESQGK